MKSKRRKPSGREKDEASVKLLEQLTERLYSDNISTARRTAFNLSWMQEDGLDILKEALFSKAPGRTKSAAAYGLRKMNGRMKKTALDVFKEGLQHRDVNTRKVCKTALSAIGQKSHGNLPSQKKTKKAKFEIKEIPSKRRTKVRNLQQARKSTPFSRGRIKS